MRNPVFGRKLPQGLVLALFWGWVGIGEAPANEEIRVTLFGQPCTMTGPQSKALLQQIHDISPEKVPPDLSIEAMKKIRTQAGNLKGAGPQLEGYRDHLRKRLSAKIAFEEALREAKKKPKASQKLDLVLANVREHIPPAGVDAFEKEMKATLERMNGEWSEGFLATLRERYESVIQADPEEEFHKAIRASKIQYVCVFDDGADEAGEGEGEEGPEPVEESSAAPTGNGTDAAAGATLEASPQTAVPPAKPSKPAPKKTSAKKATPAKKKPAKN